MIYGLSTFAWVHTILSLVGLVSGLVVLIGLFGSKKAWRMDGALSCEHGGDERYRVWLSV